MKVIKIIDDTLYTPILQHRRDNLTVTSIGAIHVGDSDYYESLQSKLESLPLGFYEGIKPLADIEKIPQHKRKYVEGMAGLKEAYQAFSKYLGCVTQHGVKYPDSWKNPDMTLDELVTRAPKRVLKKISGLKEGLANLETIYQEEPEVACEFFRRTMRVIFKHPIIFGTYALLVNGPLYNKVILGERNQRLFEAMAPELEQPKSDEMGLIYGAMHLKGVNRYLRNKGFKLEGREWIPALDLSSRMPFLDMVKRVLSKNKD